DQGERGAVSADRKTHADQDGKLVEPARSAVYAPRSTPPAGEQFQELANWLEAGLTRLEIEAIKARGVSQLLHQLQEAVDAARPPDLTEAARKTQAAWSTTLREEARANADILLATLDHYQ